MERPNILWISSHDTSARNYVYDDGLRSYLSYRSREELLPMKPLVPHLKAAVQIAACFGPEHTSHIE